MFDLGIVFALACDSVVEGLPRVPEALGLLPSATKMKEVYLMTS